MLDGLWNSDLQIRPASTADFLTILSRYTLLEFQHQSFSDAEDQCIFSAPEIALINKLINYERAPV